MMYGWKYYIQETRIEQRNTALSVLGIIIILVQYYTCTIILHDKIDNHQHSNGHQFCFM